MTRPLKWTVERRMLRVEMLLDSYVQEKSPDIKKVKEALGHLRSIRNKWIKERGWQWTLTNVAIPSTPEQEIKWYGYISKKRWKMNGVRVIALDPETI